MRKRAFQVQLPLHGRLFEPLLGHAAHHTALRHLAEFGDRGFGVLPLHVGPWHPAKSFFDGFSWILLLISMDLSKKMDGLSPFHIRFHAFK